MIFDEFLIKDKKTWSTLSLQNAVNSFGDGWQSGLQRTQAQTSSPVLESGTPTTCAPL